MATPITRLVYLPGSLSRLIVLPAPLEDPDMGLGQTFNPPLPDFVLFNGDVSALMAAL